MRLCVATGIAGLAAALPLLSGPAEAQPITQPPRNPLEMTVTSVSPSYARQGQTITITGQVRNLAATAAAGLSVQLMASHTALGSRLDLENFAHGSYLPAEGPVSVAPVTLQQLGAGQRWRFTIRLPVSKLGLTCFGVYPLTVQVNDAAFAVARASVPLPYWPPKATSCTGQRRPRPFPISWVWPLIDTPHQNACSGLTGNTLAARIAPKGRLGYLLAVGARYTSRAGLTWAVDPSLLEGVQAMSQPYQVGASPRCREGASEPADPDASRWLSGLREATAGQTLFLTPYADVDVAALIRRGNISDLRLAFRAAEQVGHQILHRSPAPAPVPAGPHQFSAIAWPAAGIASGAVLNTLAAQNVDTAILAAPAASPVSYTPGAVGSKLTGPAVVLHVLLADHAISALLGSKAAASAGLGDIFQTSQLYLAETAMIASEAPSNNRPIMIAPPRRWDPPRKLASGLLADTVSAPWLKPSTARQMVAQRAEKVYPKVTQNPSPAELPAKLLHDISKLDHRIKLLQSIRVNPDPALNRAIFGIESSAWRGTGAKHARQLFERTARYVRTQLAGVTIRGGGGRHNAYRVTFGGKTAPVNVVIHNNLRYKVRVGLQVEANHAKVTGERGSILVPALSYSAPVKLTVHVKGKHGKIRLSLTAPIRSPLAGHHPHPLPAFPLVIIVHPTDFGTVALVICAAALALFVIASAARAIKNGRPEPPGAADDIEESTGPPAPDEHAGAPAADENLDPRSTIDARSAPVPSGTTADRASEPAGPAAVRFVRPASTRPGGGHTARVVPGEPTVRRPAAVGPAMPDSAGRHGNGRRDPGDAAARDGADTSESAGRRPSPSGWAAPPDMAAPPDAGREIRSEGFLNPDERPEYTDSVGDDRSELTSAGPSVADQEPRRATEERR
jgi:hypothetical protein